MSGMNQFCIVSTGRATRLCFVVKRGTYGECARHLARLAEHNASSWLDRKIVPVKDVPKGTVGRG